MHVMLSTDPSPFLVPPFLPGSRSFSSARATDLFSQADPPDPYAPEIERELSQPQFVTKCDKLLQINCNIDFTSEVSSEEALVASFCQGSASLEAPEPFQYQQFSIEEGNPSTSTLSYSFSDRGSDNHKENCIATRSRKQRRVSTTITRTRQPRKLTTKENAKFQCQYEGCGKFFRREYNLKEHDKTHDAGREYPFRCLHGNCNKEFVRKADLDRHHKSVHAKEWDHSCRYCGRLFAREDTLSRHEKYGCIYAEHLDPAVTDDRLAPSDTTLPFP